MSTDIDVCEEDTKQVIKYLTEMSTFGSKALPKVVTQAMAEDPEVSHDMYYSFENMFYAGLILGSSNDIDY